LSAGRANPSRGGVTIENAIQLIEAALEESARVKRALVGEAAGIQRVAMRIADGFRAGQRLYACGNGGSACEAMHLVEELVARYKRERPGLPAHHLMDAATLTCWSNDYEFSTVFQRQVETMVRRGDILVAISTSGNSENVIAAVRAARSAGALTIGLTGRGGGQLVSLCDEALVVPSAETERIQEGHVTIIHLLCDLIERVLFTDGSASADH
jgi:D-sedoheptulose 7-phosphate isomerase